MLNDEPAGARLEVALSTDRWTLANKITIARILLVPVFAVTYVAFHDGYPLLLLPLSLFVAAAASDGLDGYIARTRNQRSELGAMLDPVADKFLITVSLLLVCFMGPPGALPMWLLSAVVSRDLLLLSGGIVAGSLRGKLVVRPSKIGKTATGFMMTCIIWGMTNLFQFAPSWLNQFLWWTTCLLVLISGLQYGIHGCKQAADPANRPRVEGA